MLVKYQNSHVIRVCRTISNSIVLNCDVHNFLSMLYSYRCSFSYSIWLKNKIVKVSSRFDWNRAAICIVLSRLSCSQILRSQTQTEFRF